MILDMLRPHVSISIDPKTWVRFDMDAICRKMKMLRTSVTEINAMAGTSLNVSTHSLTRTVIPIPTPSLI